MHLKKVCMYVKYFPRNLVSIADTIYASIVRRNANFPTNFAFVHA